MRHFLLVILLFPLLSNSPKIREEKIADIDKHILEITRHYPIQGYEALVNRFEIRTHNLFFAAKYYFDFTNGNDGNNGTSSVTPKKTISALQGLALVQGDSVFFARGTNEIARESWTIQQSGGIGNPIIFSTYGTGANPIISGSDIMTGGWTSFSASIWKKTVATTPKVVYFNNTRGVQKTATANILIPGDWAYLAGILYVFAPSGVDPSITYVAPGIEAGQRSRCITRNSKDNLTFIGITLRDGNNGGGFQGNAQYGGAGWTFINCVSERSAGSGWEGLAGTGTIWTNCQSLNNGEFGLLFGSGDPGSTWTGGLVSNNGWQTDFEAQQTSGFQGDLGGLVIDGVEITGSALGTTTKAGQCHGIYNSTPNTNLLYVLNSHIHGNTQGAAIKTYSNGYIYNNILENNGYEALEVATSGATNMRVIAARNQCYGSLNGFPAVEDVQKQAGTLSLNLYNNVFYQFGVGGQMNLLIGNNIDTFRLKNCVFVPASGRPNVRIASGIIFKDINYNYYGGTFENRIVTTSYTTLAAWRTACSCDANAIATTVDTSMIAPPNNMTPTPTSPLKDAGTNVGFPFNGSAPEIGAIELGSVAPKAAVPIFNTNKARTRFPNTTGVLDGSGSYDSDGSISTYTWTFISGPATPTIATPSTAVTNISGLTIVGVYLFQLKVTDNDNLSDSLRVRYYVRGASVGGRN